MILKTSAEVEGAVARWRGSRSSKQDVDDICDTLKFYDVYTQELFNYDPIPELMAKILVSNFAAVLTSWF